MSLNTFIARGFGIGLIPVSPGTFGSLPGLALGFALHEAIGNTYGIAGALVALTALAYWCIHRYEKALGVHDDQRIVLDEIVGQAIAVAFMPPSLLFYALGFVLFRVLDITKPPPIGTIDQKVKGAAGTLFDDVLAGVITAVALHYAGVWLSWYGFSLIFAK